MASGAQALAEHREIPEWTAPLEVPFLSSMDGRLREGSLPLRRYLAEQATAQVDFQAVVRELSERTDVVLELGPSGHLSGLFEAQREGTGPRCLPVDRQAQGDDCAMEAVGALFALGARLHWDRLFSRRMVRPYVPAHARLFLVNPCERPLPNLEPGRPIEVATVLEQKAQAALPLTSTDASPMEGLKTLITELTGFPASSLNENHRLLDDLNLDSIKAGERVATFARRFAPGMGLDPLGLANASLERLVAHHCARHPSIVGQCLAFSVWAGAGMGERLGSVETLAREGVRAIPRDAGVDHFRRACHTSRPARQLVITSALGDRLLDTWTRNPATLEGRFLDQIRVEEPDVEVVADAQLSLDRDAFLAGHRHRGRLLFPTVFGLEAMAQGVRRLCRTTWDGYRFEDLRLTHPIVVDEVKGVALRVRVYRRDGARFHCSLTSSETGFGLVHFEADVVPADKPEAVRWPVPDTRLPLQPGDLYQELLFQRGPFQCIEAVHAVSTRDCVVDVRAGRHGGDGWYCDPTQLVLGDPFRRDALLQAGQLMITPRLGLPVGIDAVEIRPGHHGKPLRAVAHLEGEREGVVSGHVRAIDAEGQLLERLEGYRIRILTEAPADLPTPEQLVDPSARDQRRLDAHLETLASSLHMVIPTLRLCHHPKLMSLSRDARMALEASLLGMPIRRDSDGRSLRARGSCPWRSRRTAVSLPLSIELLRPGKPERDPTLQHLYALGGENPRGRHPEGWDLSGRSSSCQKRGMCVGDPRDAPPGDRRSAEQRSDRGRVLERATVWPGRGPPRDALPLLRPRARRRSTVGGLVRADHNLGGGDRSRPGSSRPLSG